MRSSLVVPISIEKEEEDKDIYLSFGLEGYMYYANGQYILRHSYYHGEVRSESFRLCYNYYINTHKKGVIYA